MPNKVSILAKCCGECHSPLSRSVEEDGSILVECPYCGFQFGKPVFCPLEVPVFFPSGKIFISPLLASYALRKASETLRAQEAYFSTRTFQSHPTVFLCVAHEWNLNTDLIAEIVSQFSSVRGIDTEPTTSAALSGNP